MLLIVGLGNPGAEYERTFHNAGFLAVDELCKRLGLSLKDKECKALTGKYYKNGEKIVVAKPQTYMNLSGDGIRELMGKYGAKESDVIVVYDDADIPLGTLRIRKDGSAGTHNGMRDIVLKAGYTPRLRIGIRKPSDVPLRDYVLSRVGDGDFKTLLDAAKRAAEALEEYIYDRNIEKIMAKYN
ncbi:MAG: aminoacyl-tRNA hydrolase [Clostridiales bacterium]|jgi:PTH1 family peptidyl-tRNA hydrolase|nr:aminoacyl-tRNA hydrolase [Clostridiales bacterium]